MTYCIGHSILSPLATGSEANREAVMAGRSALRLYDARFADVEPFYAALFDAPQSFVDLCAESIAMANRQAEIDLSSPRVVFVLSTTKGDGLDLITPARTIAARFANPNAPVVVSNACTSGVCAQITAMRLLEAGVYDYAVVTGCDLQSRFIVSGFQSFKALSSEPCRPFDAHRKGLNLGEAAATIILSRQPSSRSAQPQWTLLSGSIHNDANHISGPSRTGEGAYRCLSDVLAYADREQLALVSVHGTATLYNDEMESIALHRAELDALPVLALKGYYGHTMGAAGLVETILSLLAVEQGAMPAAKGYAECGTTWPLNLSAEARAVQGSQFIKMLSGFGGVNAAVLWSCK